MDKIFIPHNLCALAALASFVAYVPAAAQTVDLAQQSVITGGHGLLKAFGGEQQHLVCLTQALQLAPQVEHFVLLEFEIVLEDVNV